MADSDQKPPEENTETPLEEKTEEVVADNEDEDLEHEVTHSDEHTVDVEVHKVTGSQRRLWFMVFLGVAVLSVGGFFLFKTLEGNPSNDGQSVVQRVEEVEETPPVDFVYSISNTGKDLKVYNSTDGSSESVPAATASAASVDAIQLSSNGSIRAIQTAQNAITVQGGEEDVVVTVSGLGQWVLIPDGTKIYALSGSNLYRYDTTTAEGGEVAAAFSPSGANVSNLFVARDGTARMYAKSGEELTEVIYRPNSEKPDKRTLTLTRLDQIDDFTPNSISPDGQSLVTTATINGNNTLQLISLNSFVMRTVFVPEIAGGYPASWEWSDDSNNLAINVSGSGTVRLINLKVGTLEKTVVLEQSASGSQFNQLGWSTDKSQISYTQGSTLKIVKLEGSEIVDAIQGVGGDSLTGWYRN